MGTPCAGWVQSCMPDRHRIHTPPRSHTFYNHLGGGTTFTRLSLPSTMSQILGKWSLHTRPFSKDSGVFNAKQQRWWWLHFSLQSRKMGLLKTLGF